MALERTHALETARIAAGWKRTELARRSGVSVQVIWLIETGRIASPKIDVALRLAEALGRPVEALFGLNGSSGEGESSPATAPHTASGEAPLASTSADGTSETEEVAK